MRRSRAARRPSYNDVKVKGFKLKGGLNEITPPLALGPGELYAVSNYEPAETNGYRRIGGYERVDGRPAPSEASYWILNFDAGSILQPDVGGYCFGAVTGAKGEVGLIVLSSGSWSGGTAAGYVVLYGVTGSFQDNEALSFTGLGDGFDVGFSNGFG